MSTLTKRLTLGPLLIAAVLAVAWLDAAAAGSDAWPASPWERPWAPRGVLLTFVASVAAALAAYEAGQLALCVFPHSRRSAAPLCAAVAAALTCAATAWSAPATWTVVLLATLAAAAGIVAARHKSPVAILLAVSVVVAVGTLGGGTLGLWVRIRIEEGLPTALAGLFVVKVSDIGAFAAGSLWGRRKLIPWLSPGKTWEGLAGACVAAALLGAALGLIAREAGWDGAISQAPAPLTAALGAVLALTGQLSDLLGSALKRAARVKDSSALAPGFGGALDLLDSLLLTAPVALGCVWAVRAV